MKSVSILAGVLFSLVLVQGQVTITSQDMFATVGQYYRVYANQNNVDVTGRLGSTGGPQTWDFTSGPQDIVYRFDYVSTNDATVTRDFPLAKFAERQTSEATGKGMAWLFLQQVSGKGRVNYGFYEPASDPTEGIFDPPITNFPDPLNYQGTWKCDTKFSYNFQGLIPIIHKYTSTATVDAYGTIKLPGIGSLPCLRVNQLDQHDISADVDDSGHYQLMETDYVRIYFFISPGHGIVANINSQQSFTAPPGNDFTTASQFARMFELNRTGGSTPVWTLNSTAGAGGTVSRDPDLTEYLNGAVVQLTAIANPNFVFTNWSGSISSASNPLSVTMDANKTITANFLPTYSLAATVSGAGTIAFDPLKDRYVSGETVRVTATPGAGYGFAGWTGDSTATTPAINLVMNGNKALTANFKQLRNLTITVTGQGTITPNPNAASYLDATSVQLTASASAGWQFVSWTGALAGSQNPASITMDADKTVGATFKQLFTVTTSINGQGTVSLAPQQSTYLDGTAVSVTATASAGQRFTGWSGDLGGTNNPASLLVNGNKTITAAFTPVWSLTTSAATGGTVSRDPDLSEYLNGTVVQLTAIPNVNFAFTNWGGSVSSASNPLAITMNGNKTVTANFLPTYALTLSTTGTGTVTVNPNKDRYVSGESVQITATPGAGFGFSYWSGASSATTAIISMTMNGDKAFTANFKQLRNLTLTATGQGTITPNPNAASYLDGTAVQLTASASAGWVFMAWTGALAGSQNPVSITMDADKTVGATFKQLFTVATSITGQGTVNLAPQQTNYLDGTTISASASASAGYRFTGWGGDLNGTNNPASLVVNGNKAITATFKPLWHLTTTTGQGGSVTRNPDLVEYLDGVSVALTATAQAGFAFASWSGDATGSNNPITVTMNGTKTVQASFRDIVTPMITVTSPQPGATVNENFILSGTVTDNVAVASVRWEQNGQAKGVLELNNNQFTMSALKLARGENRIRVLAKDAAGNEDSNEVVVTWNPSRTLAVIDPPEQWEGKKITVPLLLTSQGDVGGMSFVVRYNTNYLKEADLAWSSVVGASLNQVNYDMPGEVRASFSLPAIALPAGTNLIANVTFRARSVPSNLSTDLTVDIVDVSESSGQPIEFGTDAQSGTVRILQRRMKGDNNTNDRLDIGDATLIQRMVTKLDAVRTWDVTLNDLNLNGSLDSGDVTKVLRVVVGLDAQPALLGVASGEQGARSMEQGAGSMRLGNLQAAKPSPPPELVLLMPATLSGQAGDLIKLQVVLTNLQSTIAGATFVLDYPTNALRLLNSQSLRIGAFVPGTVMAVWNVAPGQTDYLAQTGRVSLAVSSATAWAGTNGVLAELTFQVQAGANGQSQWPVKLSGMEITPDGYDNRQLPGATGIFSTEGGIPVITTPILGATGLKYSSNGFAVILNGEVGITYVLEASTNLSSWTPISTNNGTGGPLELRDGAVGDYRYRFYRAKAR